MRLDPSFTIWLPTPETKNVIQQQAPEVQKFEAQLKNLISPKGDGKEKVDTAMLDTRVMDQLRSLGYLAGGGGRSYELTGTGIDPKDRIEILRMIDEAESGQRHYPKRNASICCGGR